MTPTPSAMGERWLKQVATQSAILVVLIPGILIFVGWSYKREYFEALGLLDGAALPSTPALMMQGFSLILKPLFWTGVVYIAWVLVFSKFAEIKREPPYLSLAACGTLAGMAFTLLTEWGADVESVVVGLFIILIVGLVVVVPTIRDKTAQLLAGRTVSGGIFMGLVLTFMLAGNAYFVAQLDSSDAVAGCTDLPGIRVQSANSSLNGSQVYHLLSHANGFVFVRDVEDNTAAVFAIADSKVTALSYSKISAEDEC